MLPRLSHARTKKKGRLVRRPLVAEATLQFGAHPEGEQASRINHIQDLLREAAMRGIDLIRQVETLEVTAEVLVDLVAGAEIHIGPGIHEGRFNAVLRVVLRLTIILQVRILVVDRDAHLEAVLVEERYEVVGIGEPGTAKLDTVRLLGSYGLFVLTNVALDWKPKPVSPMVYCHANSMPRTSADGPLTCEVMLKIAGEPPGRVTPLICCATVPPTTKLDTSFTNPSIET